jgi:hypothetical protein
MKDLSMSKKPSVQYEYHAKKDRLEITIKQYALEKKSERKDLMKHLLQGLEGGAGFAKAAEKKAKRGRLPKNPWKETKLPPVGD